MNLIWNELNFTKFKKQRRQILTFTLIFTYSTRIIAHAMNPLDKAHANLHITISTPTHQCDHTHSPVWPHPRSLTGICKWLPLNERTGVVTLLDCQGENHVQLGQQGLEGLGQLVWCVRNEQLARLFQMCINFLQGDRQRVGKRERGGGGGLCRKQPWWDKS